VGTPTKIYLLKKSLYNFTKSPRVRIGRFTKAIVYLEYKQTQWDHTISIKYSITSTLTILLIYVNDIISRNDENEKFALKD